MFKNAVNPNACGLRSKNPCTKPMHVVDIALNQAYICVRICITMRLQFVNHPAEIRFVFLFPPGYLPEENKSGRGGNRMRGSSFFNSGEVHRRGIDQLLCLEDSLMTLKGQIKVTIGGLNIQKQPRRGRFKPHFSGRFQA